MTSQPVTPADSLSSFGSMVAILAGMGWALSYVSWQVALPLWLVGSSSFLYFHRPVNAKEWIGMVLACFGPPLTAFVVYHCLTSAA